MIHNINMSRLLYKKLSEIKPPIVNRISAAGITIKLAMGPGLL
jgi:hypothetical protein